MPIDARIERGRDRRHALRETLVHETYDQIVIAASWPDSDGFHSDDVAWLLDHADGELVVVRPARDESTSVATSARAARNGAPLLARTA